MLLGLLLNITNLLGNLLQGVLVSGVLKLKVCSMEACQSPLRTSTYNGQGCPSSLDPWKGQDMRKLTLLLLRSCWLLSHLCCLIRKPSLQSLSVKSEKSGRFVQVGLKTRQEFKEVDSCSGEKARPKMLVLRRCPLLERTAPVGGAINHRPSLGPPSKLWLVKASKHLPLASSERSRPAAAAAALFWICLVCLIFPNSVLSRITNRSPPDHFFGLRQHPTSLVSVAVPP